MAGFNFKITRNDISPRLTRMVKAAKNPEPVLRTMGTTFMGLTMGNFNDAGAAYRPKSWPKLKRDQRKKGAAPGPRFAGEPSALQLNNILARSFHLEVDASSAKVSNPTIYAATHQFGREAANIPARPFFQVEDHKLTPKAEELIARAGQRALERQMK